MNIFSKMNPVLMLCPNGLELTKRAVASVLDQDVPVDLRVIDQASTDGTQEWLQTQIPHVKIWRFDPQLGVSAGWNFGLVDAFRSDDHCLVVNNDVVLRKDNYISLLRAPGDFVTGVSVDRIEDISGEFTPSLRPHPDFSNMLIRRNVWEKVGPFDERYWPAYYEDNDYHVRCHRAGINAYCIGVPFYHSASGTLKSASPEERSRLEAGIERNRQLFFQTYGCYPGTREYKALFA